MEAMKRVVILGSTGSIGEQALDVVRKNPQKFQVVGLIAGSSAERVAEQAAEFEVEHTGLGAAAAEQLVRALTREHRLDVLAGLAGDEPQRDQRRVGHRVVEVPDDERQRRHHLVRRHRADHVLHADRGGRLGGDVDLGVALALEAGGERQ